MRKLSVREIGADMLHDECGAAGFDWFGIGVAALLFLAMTGLEGLVYGCCGKGFLQP